MNAGPDNPGRPERVAPGVRTPSYVWPLVLACVACWSVFWLANFPAVMTPDSMSQWQQTLTGRYNDWHPVVHTLLIRVAAFVWPTPAAGIAVHIALMALALAYTLQVVSRLGCGPIPVVLTAALYLHPVDGALLATLWKDVPFTACFLAFTAALIVFSGLTDAPTRLDTVAVALGGIGMALLRHNGIANVIAGLAALGWLCRSRRRLSLRTALLVAVCLGIASVLVHRVLRAPEPPVTEALAIPLQQAGAVIASGQPLSAHEETLLGAILPIETWERHYDPQSVDRVKFLPEFQPAAISVRPFAYLSLWFQLWRDHPGVMFRAWVRQTGTVWDPRRNGVDALPRGIVTNDLGLRPAPVSAPLGRLVTAVYRAFSSGLLSWFQKPAVIHLALLLLALVCFRGAGVAALIPFAPVGVGLLVLLCFMPTSDFRYFYPGFAVLPPLAALAWRSHRRTRTATAMGQSTMLAATSDPLPPRK
ncbi:MAG TPA: DUF6020 family protein [Opitutaceae bacterium]|nr:DUF6020 family protein [Opitutaceae bacterium]